MKVMIVFIVSVRLSNVCPTTHSGYINRSTVTVTVNELSPKNLEWFVQCMLYQSKTALRPSAKNEFDIPQE